jgi:molecular chaperone DnaK
MNSGRVYGIDLGTTYSCIAYVDEHGKAIVVPNAEGELTTPSVVYFESPDNLVVGRVAKEVTAIHTDLCVSTVKRAIGDPNWQRELYGQTYKPQDISSFILRKVVGDAEKITGERIEDVVITCPAYFGVNEKEATRQAGILAGLNVLYVIPEPTAAALAYGIGQNEDQVILVYDLGGGTFDITLIEVKAGEINVICTGGDHQLGGKDWDDAIVSYFTHEFEEATGTSADEILEDQETYQELLATAERCKESLTQRKMVTAAIHFGGCKVKVDLTLEVFDRMTAQYLERTLSLTDQEIEKARAKGYAKIDKLLLVGGSTYMPQVIETIKNRFPFEVLQFDPHQAVARGAALFGQKRYLEEQIRIRIGEKTGKAAGQVDTEEISETVMAQAQMTVAKENRLALTDLKAIVEKKITNVTSKSFGIVVMNRQHREVVTNLIEIDDAVPKSIARFFATYDDGQTHVSLRCMENKQRGRSEIDPGECSPVGEVLLTFAHALPKNSPIQVTFDLGPDGRLTLKACDNVTGRQVSTLLKTESLLDEEQLNTAKRRDLLMPIAGIPSPVMPASRNQVFISYSHKDQNWLDRLKGMLKPALRGQQIVVWDDSRIAMGMPWRREIDRAIASATIAVLLVSQNFLESDFIHENELLPLLRRAEKEENGLRVVWLYLSHCLYETTGIKHLQAAHDPGKPLAELRRKVDQDKVLAQICRRIAELAQIQS